MSNWNNGHLMEKGGLKFLLSAIYDTILASLPRQFNCCSHFDTCDPNLS